MWTSGVPHAQVCSEQQLISPARTATATEKESGQRVEPASVLMSSRSDWKQQPPALQ